MCASPGRGADVKNEGQMEREADVSGAWAAEVEVEAENEGGERQPK